MSEVFPYGGTMGTLAVEMTDGQKTDRKSIDTAARRRAFQPAAACVIKFQEGIENTMIV